MREKERLRSIQLLVALEDGAVAAPGRWQRCSASLGSERWGVGAHKTLVSCTNMLSKCIK
jgi:hypothetical protein